MIGGGFTGLSAAIALRRQGLSVILLEARTCGFGASGRNAGHLTPTIGKDLFTLSRLFGRERVGALVRLMDAAISHLERWIDEHRIDCHYEPVGNLIAAIHPSQHRDLDRAAEAASRHGAAGRILEPADLDRWGIPRAVTRAFLEPHGGVLDPGLLVQGLRRVARAAGAEVYEQTPVVRVEGGATVRVRSAEGCVRSRVLVVGTNGFPPPLRRLERAGLVLHVQLFRTEPLGPVQRERIGWHGREGLYTAHQVLESYRWTPDGRILGGSKVVRYGWRGRRLPDVDPRVSRVLERTFRARFPELADVAVERYWGGPIRLGLDFLPTVARMGRDRNVLVAMGYAGHGVALASYAGEMIADLLADREGPGAALWSRRRVPTPPEPFRWLAFHALTGLLGALDGRADRAACGRASAPPSAAP